MAKLKRPRDPSQLAKLIVDLSTGESSEMPVMETARAKVGRLGGIKGGVARAASMTPEQRKKIARKAAKTRWSKKLVTVD